MGLDSEMAIMGALRPILTAIANELNSLSDPDDSYAGTMLKRLGRVALQQFEDGPPSWADKFIKMFEGA